MYDYTVSITELDRIRMSTLYSYFPNTPCTTKVRLLFDSLYVSWPPHTLNIRQLETQHTGTTEDNSHETYDLHVYNPQSMLMISLRISMCAEAEV